MIALAAILLIAAGAQDAPAPRQPATAQLSVSPPLFGSWDLDLRRMAEPPDQRPHRVIITFGGTRDGRWRMDVMIVGRDGSRLNASSTYRVDGTTAPSEGYPGVDTIAALMPAPNAMVMSLYKDRMPRTTRTYLVAPDGRTMTETVADLDLNGEPRLRINHFNRHR